MSWTGNLDSESILNSTLKNKAWHVSGLCLVKFLHCSVYKYEKNKLSTLTVL